MNGIKQKILDILGMIEINLVIPVYQRNYEWKKENCKQLLDDLIKIKKNNYKSHFFGSIVSKYSTLGANTYYIIDGQQRLTTISLLLLAMYSLLNEEKMVINDLDLKDTIMLYLKNIRKEKIKLKHIKSDAEAYSKLFNDKEDFIYNSNITINYNYFYETILANNYSIEDLYNSIQKLEIIHIQLDDYDKAQLIFESLNSTGVGLAEGDKIRNFVLIDLDIDIQNNYYEDYWAQIEKNTNHMVSDFIKDYLTIQTNKIPTNNKIYYDFKSYFYDRNESIETILKELYNYSKIYHVLLNGNSDNKKLNEVITRINQLEITVVRPFFMEVIKYNKENKISNEDVVSIFQITESYIFRRLICDLPTNALNKFFSIIHKDIIKNNEYNNYLDKYIYILLSKKERLLFPNNEEFIKKFSERNIYKLHNKNKIYLFERIENGKTKETHDIYKSCKEGKYTIEHIMPRILSTEWKKDLGNNYANIHEQWIDRLANLTLTAYNSKYSNKPFEYKKNVENGYKESGLRENQYIAQFDKWTIDEIQQRNEYLKQLMPELWIYPETTYVPQIQEREILSIEDDEEIFRGKSIIAFIFFGEEQSVKTWIEMYENIIKRLYEQDKQLLYNITTSEKDEFGLKTVIQNNQNNLRDSIEIDKNLYSETNTSTSRKIVIIRRLFDLYKVDYSELEIVVK